MRNKGFQSPFSVKMKLAVTSCCKEKIKTDCFLYAENLYQSPRVQDFIETCERYGIQWAILSDKYGLVFPLDAIRWYDLPPDKLTKSDKLKLANAINIQALKKGVTEIIFFAHEEVKEHIEILKLSQLDFTMVKDYEQLRKRYRE